MVTELELATFLEAVPAGVVAVPVVAADAIPISTVGLRKRSASLSAEDGLMGSIVICSKENVSAAGQTAALTSYT